MGVHPDIQRLIHDTFGSLTSDCVPEGAALEQLADDALAEHRRGETEPMVPDVNAAVLASLKRIERALSAIASTLTGVALLTEVLDRKYDEKYTELRRAHTDLSYRVPV